MKEKYTLSYRHSSSVPYAVDIGFSHPPYTKIISLKNKPKLEKHQEMLMQGLVIAMNNGKIKIRGTTND